MALCSEEACSAAVKIKAEQLTTTLQYSAFGLSAAIFESYWKNVLLHLWKYLCTAMAGTAGHNKKKKKVLCVIIKVLLM